MRALNRAGLCWDHAADCRPVCLRFHVVALSTVLFCGTAAGQVQFEDVTIGSGIEYSGESYGGSWGDLNGDWLPDLFVSHHRYPSGMYVNLGDGTFEDRGD